MNEQRTQAYLNLINQLLSCNEGDEPRILQENRELVDDGLVEVMVAVAQEYGEAGKENEARWLMNMAQQLAAALGLSGDETTATANTSQDYFNFLNETLQKISENPNPQSIYPFWEQNLDKLDENLIYILDGWAKNTLSSAQSEEARYIVGVIFTFSNLIAQFPLGNIADNVELAIAGYQIALIIFTFDDFPEYWAMTQNNLGNVYANRIKGNQSENIETAIFYFKEALKVRNINNFPEDWAMTQINIGNTYCNRVKEDRGENLETGIEHFQEALKVYNINYFPIQWASLQNNLSNAYRERIKGERTENLEIAIFYVQQALQIYTYDSFPVDWASTQNILGAAYLFRTKEKLADNIETAIFYFKEALKIRTIDNFPVDWAMTQNNLGNAYCQRIRGDILENLQMAFTCYSNALKIYTRENFPEKWNDIQNNLFKIYYGNIKTQNFDSDQQFHKAYFDLIQSLLICPKGEEGRILESNVELIDIHLIEMMKNIANLLRIYGREIESNWLQFTSNQLLNQDLAKRGVFSDIVSKSDTALPTTHVPDYFDISDHDFLMEVLQRVQQNPSPEYVYPLLQNNLLRLNYRYLGRLLKKWSQHKFDEVNPQDAQDIASVIWNFGVLLNQFEKGNKESNQELAILAYKIAEKIFKFENYPKNWAVLQYNLGNAYIKRIKGNKSENLEQALFYYKEALKIYNTTSFPNEWALTKINISNVYRERFKDDQADNIDNAIECLNNALQIFNRNNNPYEWGIIQLNLSGAYLIRINGNFYVNLDHALVCCQNALEILKIEHDPYEYAEAQYNLGSIYQNNINREESENVEKARKAYENASQIFTYKNYSYQWAATQQGLALVYLNKIQGNKLDNLNQALDYCYQALRIYTPKNLVYEWADLQETLGDIYSQLSNDLETIERAIAAYKYTLTIFYPQKFSRKYYQVNAKLGNLYYSINKWESATEAYNFAIEAIETIRLEALNPQRRQEIISGAIKVYHRIVQAYLNLKQPEKALEYIERSKGRNLVELMTQKNLQPQGVSQKIIEQLNELKQRVVQEQIRLQSQSINQNLMRSDNLTPYLQDQNYLKEYQQELDNFIEREIKPVDPLFSLTQKVEPIPFTDIQALTDAETCLLQWYITGEKILAFVVSADGEIKVWQSSSEDKNQLSDENNNYLELYYSETGKKEWINQLSNLLQTFADILHINDILALIPNTCKRLIIIPHCFLHILPLHALPISNSHVLKFGAGANAQDLHDLFPKGVQYAPSCQLLQIAQSFHHSDFNKLFAIQNPTKDLLYTDLEVNILSNFFTKSQSQIIAKGNATKNAILPHLKSSNNHCHHFSCHGEFNLNNPLESALFLANKEPLTLGEIFELRFNQCRLVTLSACETGLIDLNSISDEYIGLPSGFLFAGSPSVVSSLWTVGDLSTAFLMIKFYEILFNVNLNISVAVALKEAQDWLQNLTIKKLDEFLEQYQPQIDKYLAPLRAGERQDYQESLETIRQRQPYPFANPYYWAGFTATGI
jgi:CHAT domain-containing protein